MNHHSCHLFHFILFLTCCSHFIRIVTSLKISPKPCSNALGEEGTCMFVWECIKTDGKHLGTCVDGFLFGSCCGHNDTANEITSSSGSLDSWDGSSSSSISAFIDNNGLISSSTSSSHLDSDTAFFSPDLHSDHHQLQPHHQHQHQQQEHQHQQPLQHEKPAQVSSTETHFQTPQSSSSFLTQQQHHHQQQQQQQHESLAWPDFKPSSPPSALSSMTSQTSQHVKPWQPSSSLTSLPTAPVTTSTTTTTTTTAPVQMTATPASVTPATIIHSFRPPIFSIFGTHRPPSTAGISFLKPQRPLPPQQIAQATRPPVFHGRPPAVIHRPTISIFQPFAPRPTPVPIFQHPYQSSSLQSHPSQHMTTTSSTTTVRPLMHTSSSSSAISHQPVGSGSSVSLTIASSSPSSSSSSLSSTTLKPSSAVVPVLKSVECGTPPLLPQTKVVGGKNAAFGKWPWQVSVRRTSFFGFSSTHRCGGAIINSQWIATAGHCVDDLLLSQIRIRVGEYDFSSAMEPYPFVERGAKKKIVHPHYNFFTYENDLALVQLEEPITFQPHISPICLPKGDMELVGKNTTVTGWGRLSEGGVLPSVLQEVQVPIVSNNKCREMFLATGRNENIPDIFVCAGYPEGRRDSCQGDSGGPLQVKGDDGKWILVGIISWGIGCAEPNLPGVSTRISKFRDWIISVTSDHL